MRTDRGSRPGPRLEALEAREVPAAVGGLDPSFGAGGKVTAGFGPATTFQAVAVQPDGKVVAAGATNAGGSFDFLVVRFNPDGTPDAAFNQGTGKVLIDFG